MAVPSTARISSACSPGGQWRQRRLEAAAFLVRRQRGWGEAIADLHCRGSHAAGEVCYSRNFRIGRRVDTVKQTTARALPASIDDTLSLLAAADYLADRSLATVLFLALRMGRPLFLEGEAGV